MNAEFSTLAPATTLNLTLDVVELRTSAEGANVEQEQSSDTCYCCCCCCCGVESQADTTAAA